MSRPILCMQHMYLEINPYFVCWAFPQLNLHKTATFWVGPRIETGHWDSWQDCGRSDTISTNQSDHAATNAIPISRFPAWMLMTLKVCRKLIPFLFFWIF